MSVAMLAPAAAQKNGAMEKPVFVIVQRAWRGVGNFAGWIHR